VVVAPLALVLPYRRACPLDSRELEAPELMLWLCIQPPLCLGCESQVPSSWSKAAALLRRQVWVYHP
jgi:hypothetical protein